ncbi:MAG TPA: tRNA (cytidine(34)-2'-O)-methyltransferase [Candidatus Mcinerneyibacteriales bacterium]|nr:tRNA (cytidine(34)-2'-O)-methyltransferase [Candidatus Mcinerneyibacteriales bacterium]HPE20979.1 tRNA (cytidine(34)-2'-O)-methyltransferase [Candidatus Mcinerneyibacteriales bacterium]HPJ69656.1 tRNA (cytidine(34)-2'-O)-methyltransferase [Candidatus Mcinerneyibacteriales bacterium]HPQ90285.1 tRNA (cytidine(34)-2'-O)-methyltransferase [Candidatus Mcinerneyibacteriales bacterium]
MDDPFLRIVLVEPEIPPNTGTIGRLCVALNIPLLLVEPLGFSLEDKYLKRAGLDYWKELDYSLFSSFEKVKEAFPLGNFWFFTKKSPRTFFEARFSHGDFLVFGKETAGLPDALLESDPEHCLSLPMPGKTRSINLSNAVSAASYEAYRQIFFR